MGEPGAGQEAEKTRVPLGVEWGEEEAEVTVRIHSYGQEMGQQPRGEGWGASFTHSRPCSASAPSPHCSFPGWDELGLNPGAPPRRGPGGVGCLLGSGGLREPQRHAVLTVRSPCGCKSDSSCSGLLSRSLGWCWKRAEAAEGAPGRALRASRGGAAWETSSASLLHRLSSPGLAPKPHLLLPRPVNPSGDIG